MSGGTGLDRGEELAGAKLRLEHAAAGKGVGGSDVADGELGAGSGRRVGRCR